MERYRLEPAAAELQANTVAIVDVKRTKRFHYQVLHKVFKRQSGSSFKLHEMQIPEYIVPVKKILPELRKLFKDVRIVDPDRNRQSSSSEEIFFICRWPI